MIRTNNVDYFFTHQPQVSFVEELKKHDVLKINKTKKSNTKLWVEISGFNLDLGEFSLENNLISVLEDINRFKSKNAIIDSGYSVLVKKVDGYQKEEFEIEISKENTVILASETEGVRRAVMMFEDLLVQGGGNLEIKTIHRIPKIKRRLAHSFFSPINRPPKNMEELTCDSNSYFDEYLNRLMHIGVNAVWIYTELEVMVKSSYIVEFGDNGERIKKLNKIIDDCARYGIDVFLFLIGPQSFHEGAILRRFGNKMHEKYPETHGNFNFGPQAFCLGTDFGKKCLEEMVEKILISAPKLGGFCWVTHGERTTHCGNSWPNFEGDWRNDCPNCKGKGIGELTAECANIIMGVMERVAPEKEFISNAYGFRCVANEEIKSFTEKVNPKAKLMYTFEDNGTVIQLGKERHATDYYLCYPGPSDYFRYCAEQANKNGKEIYAKMQIGCSHDLASVLFIPVPGITYDRMVESKKLGVTGLLESWFFGDYPSIMTKSVEMLSFDDNYGDKHNFLTALAKLYWKEEDVDKVVRAWEHFEQAYKNYPVNVMFNYYGPMHDGVVWELQLLPKNFGLSRSWLLQDSRDGDRIGECLFKGHTIDEAITLTEQIKIGWAKGIEELSKTTEWENNKNEQINVPKTLFLLFKSGNNILRFYKLRQDLGYLRDDANKILTQLKEIVLDEIVNSTKMIELCDADSKIGYHSEAEGYKFFTEQLKHRINYLKDLLKTEFVEVENRIKNGLYPLEYFIGVEEGVTKYKAGRSVLENADWEEYDNGKSKFRIAVNSNDIEFEFVSEVYDNIYFTCEYELNFPDTVYVVSPDGKLKFWRDARDYHGIMQNKKDEIVKKWQIESLSTKDKVHLKLKISKKDAGFVQLPFKFFIKPFQGKKWCEEKYVSTACLGKTVASAGDYGWIL